MNNPAPNTTPRNDMAPFHGELVSEPSLSHRIFFGPDGLRAGWSILIFTLLCGILFEPARFIEHRIYPVSPEMIKTITAHGIPARLFFLSEFIPLIIVLVSTWIMSLIERRAVSVYGFGGARRISHLLGGLFSGVFCLSLLVLALWKSGLLAIDGHLLFGVSILRYGAVWLIGFFIVALFEESLTRGYLQYTLTRGLAGICKKIFKTGHSRFWGFWSSAIVFSVLFGLGHSTNPGESPIGMLGAALIGLALCLSLWRTGSLWWAIGFHASWDWAQSFLYGVADSGTMVQHHLLATRPVGRAILSGGATGPEGSIFLLPTVALIGLIICFTLPHTGNIYSQEPEAASDHIESPQPNGIV